MAASGFAVPIELNLERRQRQAADAHQEHEQKINDLLEQRQALVQKIPNLQQGTPEYDQAHTALQGVIGGIQDFYHPQKNPGAIEKFGHVVTDHMGLTKPQATDTMVNPKASGLIEPGNIKIWDRPAVQNADGSHSSEYSTSFQDDKGNEVLVPTVVNGKFLTPDGKKPAEGSPEEKAMFKAAWDHYTKTGENLGKFKTPKDADAYANILHNRGAAPKNIAQQQAKTTATGKATDQAIAAAPLSTIQTTTQQMQAKLDIIDKSGLSPEEKKEAKLRIFGVTNKPVYKLFDMPDGSMESIDIGHDPIPEGAKLHQNVTTASTNIEGYQRAVEGGYKGSYPEWIAEERRKGAPSTSALNEYAASYQKAYGITAADMTPADWDFIQRKQAFDKAIPQTTTANTVKQNFQEQWVPIQETNTKTPGGAPPMPPRGKPVNNTPPPSLSVPTPPAAAATPPTTTTATPANPKDLKKEAEARKPKTSETTSSDSSTPRATGANASIKVGDPIMAAPSKEFRDARATYHGAILRQQQMHNYLRDAEKPGPPNQQAMLGLLFNHIGMTQGAQKGARINQKSVDEAKASTPWLDAKIAEWFHQDQNGDYIFDGLKGGINLTKPQMEQMVELADEGVKTFKDNLDTIESTLNDGVTHPSKTKSTTVGKQNSGSSDKPPKATKPAPQGATHYKKHGDKWYYTDDQGKNLGEVI